MRRKILIVLVLIGIAFVFIGGPSLFASPSTSDVAPEEDEAPDLVTFDDSESGFWAFMNSAQSFEKRSPINVIVRGDSGDVIQALSEEGNGEWEEMSENETDAEPETYSFLSEEQHHATGLEWGEAAGTTRYAWVDPGPNESGYWMTETLQLDNGDYYGHRMHIRLYEAPNENDNWVAMQGHTEHFDWFTLRHRVDGVESAQLAIERDFMSLPSIDNRSDVTRINIENSGPSDADGWATLVDLVGMILLPVGMGLTMASQFGDRTTSVLNRHLTRVDRKRIAVVTDRIEARHLMLAATILTLFLGVRIIGVVLERHVDFLSMHMIAALLYPIIAIGIPVATYAIAHGLERRMDAAITASLALAVAIWIDYGAMGVDSLPIDVVVQRMFVVVTIGLIAAGAARRATRDTHWNSLLLTGVLIWVLVLGGTLFGYF